MMTKQLLSPLCLLILAAGCAVEGAPDPDDADSSPGFAIATRAQTIGGSTATIHGKVFYNDRRNFGLFSVRKTPTGAAGTKCGTAGVRDDGTACSTNWLGAQYAVVDVIERDEGFGLLDTNCHTEDILDSVAVNADGSFTATVPTSDACRHDDLVTPAIVLKVRLKYCGAWCFSMNKDDNTPYSLNYPGATPSAPLFVNGGDDVTLGNMLYNPAGLSQTVANDTSKAANYYASVVDTVLTINRDAGVPFFKAEYGELQYVFPSTQSSTATTLGTSKVAISTFESGWTSGWTPAHEYGHVLMLRAWGGVYGFDGIGNSANDSTIASSQQIAFKEAWAEFTAHAVFPTSACDASSFDDNSRSGLPGPLGQGAQWRLNVTKALCDWYDSRDDNDLTLAGAGDHFNASSLYSVWFNLRDMYLQRYAYANSYFGAGFYFCDYVNYYLDVRQSTAAVGAASHDNYVTTLVDLIYNNNIACFYPSP